MKHIALSVAFILLLKLPYLVLELKMSLHQVDTNRFQVDYTIWLFYDDFQFMKKDYDYIFVFAGGITI